MKISVYFSLTVQDLLSGLGRRGVDRGHWNPSTERQSLGGDWGWRKLCYFEEFKFAVFNSHCFIATREAVGNVRICVFFPRFLEGLFYPYYNSKIPKIL